MTADLIIQPVFRRTASWAGRASQHRREQVRGRDVDAGAQVHCLWESLVDVLRSIDTPASALLCTAEGDPVAAYGLQSNDLPLASRRTTTMFATRAHAGDGTQHAGPGAVETVELTAGQRHTVIASVPAHPQADHLLCVSAEGVSPLLLQAWTKRAAEDLRVMLVDQGASTSSSAAL